MKLLFWKKYSILIVACSVFLLIALFTFSQWVQRNSEIRLDLGDRLYKAIAVDSRVSEKGRISSLKKIISDKHYSRLSKLYLASLYSNDPELVKEGIELYDELIEKKDLIGDIAIYRKAMLLIDNGEDARSLIELLIERNGESDLSAALELFYNEENNIKSDANGMFNNEVFDRMKNLISDIKAMNGG